MVQGLFQPMHLLLILLFLVGGGLLVILLLALIMRLKVRPPAAPPTSLDPQARLERLAALKQKALISDDEYQAKRRQLLDEL
jgi:hypothetical protein